MTVLGLLIGSVVRSSYKWGYFTFACVGFILEAIQLLWFFRRSAIKSDFSKAGTTVTFLATLLLMLYPVAWALSYGGNVIQPDSEAVFFGVLDLSYFVILGAIFLYFTNGIDFSAHGIATLGAPVLHPLLLHQPSQRFPSKEAVLERHSWWNCLSFHHFQKTIPFWQMPLNAPKWLHKQNTTFIFFPLLNFNNQ